ncbi:uncharacterized protein LOC131645903 [Vicia villosa]|uniref:uncharacterized protein LOC131645903 n=1 Tax=Vicia villosa TaxID=3911 RepID=UPI00273C9B19|nr:uncharacterized protein LOC131645903 [Vicia villosa]
MSYFSGPIQRPLVAAAAVAVASFSTDASDKFSFLGSSSRDCSTSNLECSSSYSSLQESHLLLVNSISDSKLAQLYFVNKIRVPVPNVRFRAPVSGLSLCNSSSVGSSPVVQSLYRSAELPRFLRSSSACSNGASGLTNDFMYKWHLPEPNTIGGLSAKSKTVVVLLGWLGAKQKHLKKYAEWYTSKGYHVITFTFPMAEVMSYQPGGKAEQNVHMLVDHLADWLEEENEKNLVFHTFSNTGWLTYGVILERFQKQDPSLMGKIRGCIVDSAPVANPDPQVWASGFSAAFLKKNSVATKGRVSTDETGIKVSIGSNEDFLKPAPTEAALLLILKKFFEVVLHLPAVNRRLSDVLSMLSTKQPGCPQLYMYSSADRVIPADSVESFVDAQRKAGHDVRACNFVSSPHVDHFRNDPKLYTSQLNQFLEECVDDHSKTH